MISRLLRERFRVREKREDETMKIRNGEPLDLKILAPRGGLWAVPISSRDDEKENSFLEFNAPHGELALIYILVERHLETLKGREYQLRSKLSVPIPDFRFLREDEGGEEDAHWYQFIQTEKKFFDQLFHWLKTRLQVLEEKLEEYREVLEERREHIRQQKTKMALQKEIFELQEAAQSFGQALHYLEALEQEWRREFLQLREGA